EDLTALLFRCYREFYSTRDVLAKSARWFWRKRASGNVLLQIAVAAYSFLSRLAVRQRLHPMAGGTFRVALDGVEDYRTLRRARFGVDLLPLPASLRPADGMRLRASG